MSDQSKHILPGRPTSEATEDMAKKEPLPQPTGAIQQVAYRNAIAAASTDSSGGSADPNHKMSTTTISIPTRFGQRTQTSTDARPQGVPASANLNQNASERIQAAADRKPRTSSTGEAAGVISATAARTNSSDSRPNHSQPFRHRVLGAPISRLERDRVPWPPHPSEQSSAPGPSP